MMLLTLFIMTGAIDMATKSETIITQDIIAWVKENGGDAFHVHGSTLQRGGEPDITGEIQFSVAFIREWKHLKIEVKTPEGKPTERQLYRLNKYNTRGYVVGIVTSVDDMKRLMAAYDYYFQYDDSSKVLELPYAEYIYS